jgi:DNA-binding NarL/FixJ family response regulator
MGMIRVLLVNETRLVGHVTAAVLEEEKGIRVVDSLGSVAEGLARATECDVLLVSATLPGGGAARLARAVSESASDVKVLVTGLPSSEQQILPYIEAGACGYVLEDDSVKDLLRRIRAAYHGKALVSPEVAAGLISRVRELARQASPQAPELEGMPRLTAREREVLELLREGLSNQEIADRLGIRVGTVKNHVHSILQKLGLDSRFEAGGHTRSREG